MKDQKRVRNPPWLSFKKKDLFFFEKYSKKQIVTFFFIKSALSIVKLFINLKKNKTMIIK